jgi:hypothetical protein
MSKKAKTGDARMIASPQNSISRFFADLAPGQDAEDFTYKKLSAFKLYF